MAGQSLIGCIDQVQQLRAVAFEMKPASHELKFAPARRHGPFAKRIGFNVWSRAVILEGHMRLYPSADDNVAQK
jgi:hypothetical protein